MSIIQFFRIIWARRFLIVGMPLATLLLGLIVVVVAPAKYQAETRIMLDVIKPDPVTGEIMSSPFLRAYTRTQTELIQDLKVASRVVQDLKWADDQELAKLYNERKKSDDRDFTRWAAQRVIDGTTAKLIEGSNIIEISYAAKKAEEAKEVADAIRVAYIATSLDERRETAKRNAEWYDAQAEKAKGVLIQAETEKSTFERANGILLQDDKTDVDSARLAALASQGGAAVIAQAPAGQSPAALQVAQLDGQIAQAEGVLGPNHPDLLEMRRKRQLLQAQANQERAALNAAAGAGYQAQQATAGMLEAQKSKVMAQREKVERLRLLQDNVVLRREQYNKAATRAAELRQEAEVAETSITTLGSAATPQSPVFPNVPLILGAALIVGAGGGVLLALILEILMRRVRSAEDLTFAIEAPVLAIITDSRPRASSWRFGFGGNRRPGRGMGATAVRA